jgi:ribosome-binding protein aMBF1 (putative translation factor)
VKNGQEKTLEKPTEKSQKKARKRNQITREGKLFLKAFGNRVRELREKEGMSQDQLGYECGMDRTTILRMEKGHYETGITSLFLLAKALGVEEADLVNFKKNQPISQA